MPSSRIQDDLRACHIAALDGSSIYAQAADRIDALETAAAKVLAIIDEGHEATCELEIEDAQQILRFALEGGG